MKTGLVIGIGAAAAGGVALYLTRSNQKQIRNARNHAKGAVHTVTPTFNREQMDDQTLADRVRSEIFRDTEAPKGSVSVDVQAGVAYLRGEVADEAWIERFGKEARKVTGITGVKNLLHAPGTPTPSADPTFHAAEKHNH